MNELLSAMLAEADHLAYNGNEPDVRISNSLRRIVQQTRDNIRRAEREYWLNKYQAMYPIEPRELTATDLLKIRGGILLDNKPTT